MSSANINVRTDAQLKAKAQEIYESVGLDLSTAVNLFLKQTVLTNNLPFPIGIPYVYPTKNVTEKRTSRYGIWKDKFSLPDNFDEPIDIFEDYM